MDRNGKKANKQSDDRSHMSCVNCHGLYVMCHVSCVIPQPQTSPLITPPLCTVGWFADPKTPNKCQNAKTQRNNIKTKMVWMHVNISYTQNQKSPVHRAVRFLLWHTHTNRHTHNRHVNSMTDLARRATQSFLKPQTCRCTIAQNLTESAKKSTKTNAKQVIQALFLCFWHNLKKLSAQKNQLLESLGPSQ